MFDWRFYCYQSLPIEERQLDIYDEIHDALTPKYMQNIKLGAKYKIGLSATIPKNYNIFRADLDYKSVNKVHSSKSELESGDISFINKGQLLDKLCPIVYVYTLEQGITEGLLSPFKTYIIEHTLDTLDKSILIWKSKGEFGSESDYYHKRARLKQNYNLPFFMKQRLGKEMTLLLYELPSKTKLVKNLLETISGKTIIFGTRLEQLKLITDNVVEGKNFNELVAKFNEGSIKTIASSKKLKQGITLEGIENCIIVSYFSTFSDIIQQLGRIVRFVEGKVAKLYIIVTLNTFEEKWFGEMQNMYDEKGKLEGTVDLKIADYISSKSLLKC
jgi:superfamily II DNA or RNA helicase